MKTKLAVCMVLVIALLTGCASSNQGQATTPEVTFTTQPTTQPVTEPTTEPTTEPATVPTTVPETEPILLLQPGYYLLDSISMDGMTLFGPAVAEMKCYVHIREDNTGTMSIVGMGMDFTWDDTELVMEGIPQPYTLEDDLLIIEDGGQTMILRFGGDTLPEEYLPVYPVGFFAVSSVGRNGNVAFYPTIDPKNGYIRIHEDLTGVMVFDGVIREFTMDESYLYTQNEQIPYRYTNEVYEEDFGEEPMLMVYLDGEEFVSIVFRPADDPENT